MSVTVIVHVSLKPEFFDAYTERLKTVLPETLAAEGCESLSACSEPENPGHIFMIERWATRAHYEKYLAWRTETGAMDRLASMSTAPVRVRYMQEFAGLSK